MEIAGNALGIAMRSDHELALEKLTMEPTLVSRDPEVMSGELCFTGTRVPVQNLFDYLEGSSSLEEFLEDFPSISRERAVGVTELYEKTRG